MIARTSIPLRFLGLALSLVTLGAFVVPARLASPPVAAGLLSGLVWRNLGPFRGGRIAAVSGAIGQPLSPAPLGALIVSKGTAVTSNSSTLVSRTMQSEVRFTPRSPPHLRSGPSKSPPPTPT